MQKSLVVTETELMTIEGYEFEFIAPDAEKIKQLKSKYDMIYVFYSLQRIAREHIFDVVKSFHSMLSEEGRLIVIVPDLEVVSIELLSATTNVNTWDNLYGTKDRPHQSGYTSKALQGLLVKYGFDIIKAEVKGRELRVEAKKNGIRYDG